MNKAQTHSQGAPCKGGGETDPQSDKHDTKQEAQCQRCVQGTVGFLGAHVQPWQAGECVKGWESGQASCRRGPLVEP